MKKYFKDFTISSYFNVISIILILVSMILAISSSSNVGYAIDELGWIIFFSILSIVLILSSFYLGYKFNNNLISFVPLLISVILLGLCFMFVLNSRTYLIGTLWVTKLDQSNSNAVNAMNTGAPSFIMYLVSMVLITITSFFNIKKENKKTQTM